MGNENIILKRVFFFMICLTAISVYLVFLSIYGNLHICNPFGRTRQKQTNVLFTLDINPSQWRELPFSRISRCNKNSPAANIRNIDAFILENSVVFRPTSKSFHRQKGAAIKTIGEQVIL